MLLEKCKGYCSKTNRNVELYISFCHDTTYIVGINILEKGFFISYDTGNCFPESEKKEVYDNYNFLEKKYS